MSIPFGFLLIPAGILRNSWNSAEFLDSGRTPRNLAGISGGMESIDGFHYLFGAHGRSTPVDFHNVRHWLSVV